MADEPAAPVDAASSVRLGVAFFPDPAFVAAVLPWLGRGVVDVLQLTVDSFPLGPTLDPALDALLHAFGPGRLSWHVVSGSPHGPEPHEFDALLARCRALVERHGGCRVSEHVGFASGPAHVRLPPLPPPGRACDALAAARLRRLADATGLPVGIENLAFAFDRYDVEREPDALAELLDACDGFLLLDLHNLHCRAVNFGLDPLDLLRRYPLHRVREAHVAGGRTIAAAGRPVRRDTHDGPVPDDVLELLERLLHETTAPIDVFVERVPSAFGRPGDAETFGDDLRRTRATIARAPRGTRRPGTEALPAARSGRGDPLDLDACLAVESALADALDGAADAAAVRSRLRADPRAASVVARFERAPDAMLETAARLVERWAVRRGPA